MTTATPVQYIPTTAQADFLRAWVAALESGSFRQTVFGLVRRSPDRTTYCCLGVACEVARTLNLDIGDNLAFEDGAKYDFPTQWFANLFSGDPHLRTSVLHDDEFTLLLLPPPGTDLPALSNTVDIAGIPHVRADVLNDVLKLPFSDIAKWIRNTYPSVFSPSPTP